MLSTFSSLSVLSGIATSLVNNQLETKYQSLSAASFLTSNTSSKNTQSIPSHSAWYLMLNSGSFSYLTKLVNQLDIDSTPQPTQVASAGNFSSSAELYPQKLQQLVNSFLKDLSWTHLIAVLEEKKDTTENTQQNNNSTSNINTLFPDFKAKFLSLNHWVELSVFTLTVCILCAVALSASALYFCSNFNNLEKKEKLKWLIYHLLTQLPGWMLKYRRKLSQFAQYRELPKLAPLCSKDPDLLCLSNLSYSLENSEILKDINLKLQKAEFYAIIGANGAGKTTLLKQLAKLLTPSKGEILLNSRSLNSIKNRNFWARVAYIPQELTIPPDTPVYDFLLSSRFITLARTQRATPVDHLRVLKAIQNCQLQHLRWAKIGDLSGGQRQKVILASILVKDAELILLDEPTTFLDTANRAFLVNFFRKLHSQGKTIIANLHNFAEVNKLATQVIAMKGGRIHQIGKKDKLLTPSLLNELYDLTLPREKWNSLLWNTSLNY
ncbi:ABC transporter ATP-binding protein [Candidatus Mycoplasma haematominutum]|uniref:ABC transporter ATP-binding protein n=1 Tax=Candidatus Mycoplasma haematominutum TaxID=209446 RepID=UPI0016518DEB|nr:ABC transporter ATP-binding protein [Candidatus Mycoplasma haematominutum]